MSEAPKDDDKQLRIPDDLGAINKDMTAFMADMRARHGDQSGKPERPEDVVREAARVSLRVIEGGGQEPRKDTGTVGNPEKDELDKLRQRAMLGLDEIETQYNPLRKKDKNIYMLHRGALALLGVMDTRGWDINRYVETVTDGLRRIDPQDSSLPSRNEIVRNYDSLGLLANAFSFAVKNPETGERSDIHLEQFILDHAPSPLWVDEELRNTLLEVLDTVYALSGKISSPDHRSINDLITKLRLKFLEQGLGWKIPRKRDRTYGKFRANLENAELVAWAEWEALAS